MSSDVLCQSCDAPLHHTLVDLGLSPLANSFVPVADRSTPDQRLPLHVRVCTSCWLVQAENVVGADEIFTHYAYLSSYSDTWLAHASAYTEMTIDRFGLDHESQVIEIASNDGYLLQFFVERGIPSLGIEPAANVAEVAREKAIPTVVAFFGSALAEELRAEGHRPDLIASKNVLAHVPDIEDFVRGVSILLPPGAVYTVEFPHLLNLIAEVQFDTIYHEHYYYLSLVAVERIFRRHGLRIFDVEELPTHGGSLRVFACQSESPFDTEDRVEAVRRKEIDARIDQPEGYAGFEDRVKKVRDDLLEFLHLAQERGQTVAAYGAAAKGNTLLNYCGIDAELVRYVVDRNPMKQGTLLPGSRIPVRPVEQLESSPPDYVLILPWNLREEIMTQLDSLHSRGVRFVTAIPEVRVWG